MADVHTPEQRHRNMAAIRGRNTAPELRVRQLLYSMGYRYRLHRADLPGKPDIVLGRFRLAIFVNGCYWHCHDCRWGRVKPATRAEFWASKRAETVRRDQRKREELEAMGWQVAVLWECETKKPELLQAQLENILRNARSKSLKEQ